MNLTLNPCIQLRKHMPQLKERNFVKNKSNHYLTMIILLSAVVEGNMKEKRKIHNDCSAPKTKEKQRKIVEISFITS